MNKKHLALIVGVIALIGVIVAVMLFQSYTQNNASNETAKADSFEQKLKGMSNVTFFSATKAELNSELKGTGQSQYTKVSETEFISSVQTTESENYTSYIARIGNTFYFVAQGQTYVYCTP